VSVRFSSFVGKDDNKEVLSVSFSFHIHLTVQTDGPLKLKQNLKRRIICINTSTKNVAAITLLNIDN
jgi:hypothetical protein